jgi:hypothetical protein
MGSQEKLIIRLHIVTFQKIFLWLNLRQTQISHRLLCLMCYVPLLRTAALGLLCDLSYTFQLSPPGVSTRVTTREHPAAEGGTVGEKCPGILPKYRLSSCIRELLHAVKLRHGTEHFTFPPKEGVLRSFSP